MPVTVDRQTLAVEQMGLTTVGHVLSHLRKENRLVVNVLIDGQAPDLDRLGELRQSELNQVSLYIETADPRQLATEILGEVENQLLEADPCRAAAAELLGQNQPVKALEKLGGCLTTWNHAQESVRQIARLLSIDLQAIRVGAAPLQTLLEQFAQQLRSIRKALEDRDFVQLADILTYETTQTNTQWRDAIEAMRQAIQRR